MRTRPLAPPVIALALLAAACAGGSSSSSSSATGGATSVSTPTSSPTAPTSESESSTPSAPASPVIEDGKNFAFVKKVDTSSNPATITYDLAYLLTGDAAEQAAKDHGDEVPPPNDYYIVNDNPRLRTVELPTTARIELFDWNNCCDDTFKASVDEFAQAINAGNHQTTVGDGHLLNGRLSPYWLYARDGRIVRIEEQFLP